MGAENCCRPSGTQNEGRRSGFTPLIHCYQTDDLTSAKVLKAAEYLGPSICAGLVRGLEKVVNPIFLLSKPLTI